MFKIVVNSILLIYFVIDGNVVALKPSLRFKAFLS